MGEKDQQFKSKVEWECKATSWLTRHPKFGPNFRAICFDAKGRHVTCGADFMRADREGAFPVRWLWPDQVGPLALGLKSEA